MSYEQLTGADYLATFAAENVRFISAAQASGFAAPVASCPGWNVGDLVFHVGKVQRWFHFMLSTNGADPKGSPRSAKPETDAARYWAFIELMIPYLDMVDWTTVEYENWIEFE